MNIRSGITTAIYVILGLVILILVIAAFRKGGIFSKADQVHGFEVKVTGQIPDTISLEKGTTESIIVEIEGQQDQTQLINQAKLVEVDKDGNAITADASQYVFGQQTSAGVIRQGSKRQRLTLPVTAKDSLVAGSYNLYFKLNLGDTQADMAVLFDASKDSINSISFPVEMK